MGMNLTADTTLRRRYGGALPKALQFAAHAKKRATEMNKYWETT